MTDIQMNHLLRAIKKWETFLTLGENETDKIYDEVFLNVCDMLDDGISISCKECKLHETDTCRDSPFTLLRENIHIAHHCPSEKAMKKMKAGIKEEVKFLKSLRNTEKI